MYIGQLSRQPIVTVPVLNPFFLTCIPNYLADSTYCIQSIRGDTTILYTEKVAHVM